MGGERGWGAEGGYTEECGGVLAEKSRHEFAARVLGDRPVVQVRRLVLPPKTHQLFYAIGPHNFAEVAVVAS